MIVTRIVWVMSLQRRAARCDPHYGYNAAPATIIAAERQGRLLISWCGMRGIVTLAAAFALAGRAFPIAT